MKHGRSVFSPLLIDEKNAKHVDAVFALPFLLDWLPQAGNRPVEIAGPRKFPGATDAWSEVAESDRRCVLTITILLIFQDFAH